MFEGFNPTKSEIKAINAAWYLVEELTGSDYRSFKYMKDESLGYGSKSDRIPQCAAKGLCVSWFMDGMENPDALLRDKYYTRPASIWFKGYAARIADEFRRYGTQLTDEYQNVLNCGKNAYDTAFNRMISQDGGPSDER